MGTFCLPNVAMVFRKGSEDFAPMAMAVDACATLATKVRGERSSPRSRAGNVVRRLRQGSGVTPMARVAVDECATLAAKGRCERNNKNVESLVLRLLMTTFNEKQKR